MSRLIIYPVTGQVSAPSDHGEGPSRHSNARQGLEYANVSN